jgi:hypothetical protein
VRWLLILGRRNKVSIPHRFNSHPLNVRIDDLFEHVSIPHRFNSHLRTLSMKRLAKFVFQSLTGSIHTKTRGKARDHPKEVSIPHRFNSHKTEVKL